MRGRMSTDAFERYFRGAPTSVDVEAIRREWLALAPPYDVETWILAMPRWTQRGYDYSGQQAWDLLQCDLSQADRHKPFCIYLHVPFCTSKCGFCDSYSFKLGSHQTEQQQAYVARLCDELCIWSVKGNLSQPPVSTVHLGGGTPTFLGERNLTRLVECVREYYQVSKTTEWALESTVQSLTPGMIRTMHQLGFRRLHVGVQTMESHVREAIGRRCSVEQVLERIETTLGLGWVVSVDLICGLPHQTLSGFVRGLETLINLGVHGFSMYELLIYPQNRKWAASHQLTERSHLPNYWLYQAGSHVLLERGLALNHFNHWANPRDANLYFSFPERNEDCLAVGTIADGVFGDFHYRHPRYAPYMQIARADFPGLEGGLRLNAREQYAHPVSTAIQAGYLTPTTLPYIRNIESSDECSTLEHWQEMLLVTGDERGGLRLTTNGSWFTGNMIRQVEDFVEKVPSQSLRLQS